MKNIFIIGCLLFSFSAFSQISVSNFTGDFSRFGSKRQPVLADKPLTYSTSKIAKRLDVGYRGYLVELLVSNRPLRRSHDLFSLFGDVYYLKIPKRGYVYYIPLGFESKKASESYLKQVISPKVPAARIVKI